MTYKETIAQRGYYTSKLDRLTFNEIGCLGAFDLGVSFTPVEQKVISACEALRDNENLSVRKVAEHMGCSEPIVYQANARISAKVVSSLRGTSNNSFSLDMPLARMGEIPAPFFNSAKHPQRERQLMATITSLPEDQITLEAVVEKMQASVDPALTQDDILQMKRNIERRLYHKQQKQGVTARRK